MSKDGRDMVHLKECGLPFHACATGMYEEFKFKTRNLEIINGHDASDADAPLFLCYTSHIVHEPLQVPVETWNEFDFIGTSAVGDFQNRECSAATVGLARCDSDGRPLLRTDRQTYHASASIDSPFIFPPAVLSVD